MLDQHIPIKTIGHDLNISISNNSNFAFTNSFSNSFALHILTGIESIDSNFFSNSEELSNIMESIIDT